MLFYGFADIFYYYYLFTENQLRVQQINRTEIMITDYDRNVTDGHSEFILQVLEHENC